MRYVIGLDLGTSAIKIALFDQNGHKIAGVTEEYELLTPSAHVVEQDVQVYWDVFKSALGTLLKRAEINVADIAGIGISAQGETLIAIDGSGAPLRRAIVWMDNRAQVESDTIEARFTNENIHRTTGQVAMTATWPAAKILWIKNNEPEVFRKVYKYLLIEDYFLYRFTGRFVAEGSLLCSTILWDINTRKYWTEMMQFLGIDESQLPEIREPGELVGSMLPDVAAELGLSPATMCALGALDQACGAIGAGNVKPGMFSESTGSALAIVAVTDSPVFDPTREMPCFYFGIPGKYMVHSFTTGGMLIRWYRDTLCRNELLAEEISGFPAYNLMDLEAAKVPIGSDGLTVLPHLQGSGPPDTNQAAKAVFCGLTMAHTKQHMSRACLESVAMTLCRMLDATESMGTKVTEIRSLSGGAKSPFWCQMKADATGKTVRTMRNTEDSACLGAAILAGVAVGLWKDVESCAAKFIEDDKVFIPAAENFAAYRKVYERYKDLQKTLHDFFIRW